MTPQSQRVPPAQSLTPVIDFQNHRKDKYDPTNVSHKTYFMPQAYPPASSLRAKSQNRSNTPLSDRNSANTAPI